MARGWKITAAVAVFAVLALLGAITIADSSDDDNPSRRVGRITTMEGTGEMHDMLEQHRVMLERMQQDASPAMLQLMNDDAMWRMMRSPEWARMDEQHQQDVRRMLGE